MYTTINAPLVAPLIQLEVWLGGGGSVWGALAACIFGGPPAGGMDDGTNYKGDPAQIEGLTWEQIVEKADATVFSVKARGTNKRLTGLRQKALEGISSYIV